MSHLAPYMVPFWNFNKRASIASPAARPQFHSLQAGRETDESVAKASPQMLVSVALGWFPQWMSPWSLSGAVPFHGRSSPTKFVRGWRSCWTVWPSLVLYHWPVWPCQRPEKQKELKLTGLLIGLLWWGIGCVSLTKRNRRDLKLSEMLIGQMLWGIWCLSLTKRNRRYLKLPGCP